MRRGRGGLELPSCSAATKEIKETLQGGVGVKRRLKTPFPFGRVNHSTEKGLWETATCALAEQPPKTKPCLSGENAFRRTSVVC